MGAFKRFILQIEVIEDNNDWVNNWSVSIVGGFKRLIVWVEGTEHNNGSFVSWSAA